LIGNWFLFDIIAYFGFFVVLFYFAVAIVRKTKKYIYKNIKGEEDHWIIVIQTRRKKYWRFIKIKK